ncbi:hypothetical protein BS78_07G197900 [Paspalum vaginatum]|nr:hypothetical protein BS78_07G197900 [Paspalum vaginatum]
MLPTIVLHVEAFKPPDDDDGFKSTVSDTAWSNMALAQAAKSVLRHKSHRPIAHLALTLYLIRHESVGIVRAVGDAMSPGRGRGVVEAKLKFLGEKRDFACNDRDMDSQGKHFLSCFNACPRAFAGLTGLRVETVRLGESDVLNVLRTCRKLKRLSLDNCDWGSGTVLALEHPELTKLKLELCGAVELRWLPKLAQVTCYSWVPSQNNGYPLLFGHVPRLQKLRLFATAYSHYPTLLLSKLLANCTTLHELYLNFDSQRIWIQPEGPQRLAPLLENLMVLNLDKIYQECDLTWTLFLLQAAPFLKKLQIQVLNHECAPVSESEMPVGIYICEKYNIKWELPADFKHHDLVKLEVYGFQPDRKFMGYIKRVMMAAVNLEVVALNDKLCQHCGYHPVTRYPGTKERDLIRRHVNLGITSRVKDVQFHEMSLEGRPIRIID